MIINACVWEWDRVGLLCINLFLLPSLQNAQFFSCVFQTFIFWISRVCSCLFWIIGLIITLVLNVFLHSCNYITKGGRQREGAGSRINGDAGGMPCWNGGHGPVCVTGKGMKDGWHVMWCFFSPVVTHRHVCYNTKIIYIVGRPGCRYLPTCLSMDILRRYISLGTPKSPTDTINFFPPEVGKMTKQGTGEFMHEARGLRIQQSQHNDRGGGLEKKLDWD